MNQTAESLWFVFYKDELLLEKEGNGTFAIPCGEIPPILIKDKTTVHNITTLEGRNCVFTLCRGFFKETLIFKNSGVGGFFLK